MQIYQNNMISPQLITEIKKAIEMAGSYGSIEIFIQNNNVTQITMRNIRKIPDIVENRMEKSTVMNLSATQ
jgi:hypothetical protein